MLVNLCYVSRGLGVRKASNSKSDLQGHWSPIMVPLDRTYDFLLVCYCNHASILHRFRHHLFPKI